MKITNKKKMKIYIGTWAPLPRKFKFDKDLTIKAKEIKILKYKK